MPKITASGSLSGNFAAGASSLTVASAVLGYLRVLTIGVNSTVAPTGVSGGGVGTWSQAALNTANSQRLALYWGQVTSNTNPTTISVTYSGSVTSTFVDLASQMFASDRLAPQWYLDVANTSNSASATTIAWPSLTPTKNTPAVYFGVSFVANTGSAGSTSGFTNGLTSGNNPYAYRTDLSATGSPTASQSPAGFYDTTAAVIGCIDLGQFFA